MRGQGIVEEARPGSRRGDRDPAPERRGSDEHARPSLPHRPALSDRYELAEGRILLTGLQALVRLPLDQHRADLRRGLHTGTMISGYQGSPLGGLDKELAAQPRARRAAPRPARARPQRGARRDRRRGAASWPASSPARRTTACSACGTARRPASTARPTRSATATSSAYRRTGGALAVVGDDPGCKSSTIPSASRGAAAEPPHAGASSPATCRRCSTSACTRSPARARRGCGPASRSSRASPTRSARPTVARDRVMPRDAAVEWNGRPYEHVPNGNLLAPASLDMERTLLGRAHRARARLRARERREPRSRAPGAPGSASSPPGKTYYDLDATRCASSASTAQASSAPASASCKLGMIWPLEPRDRARVRARASTRSSSSEEKGPFLETHLKDALYGAAGAPRIVGKHDERRRAAAAARAATSTPTLIARALAARLEARGVRLDSVEARLRQLAEIARPPGASCRWPQRTPFFCSGCPHNSST